MSFVFSHWPQFAIAILLALRAGNVITADIKDSRTRRSYKIHGILISELTFNVLFVSLLWAGGFWK